MATPWSLSICVRLQLFGNCGKHAGKHLSVRSTAYISHWEEEKVDTRLIHQGWVLAHLHYWHDVRGKEANNYVFISCYRNQQYAFE